MAFSNLQEPLCGTGWFAVALFPLLQGTLGHTQRCGKLGLGKPAHQPHANDVGLSSNVGPLSFSSFDLPHTVQDFLPHIAFGLEVRKRLSGQLFTHLFSIPLCH